jgi:preprotein translocase subunit SecE
MYQKIVDYIKTVKAEMVKVAWPTRKDLAGSTGVVLVLVGITTVFLGIVDWILYTVVTRVLGI